MNYLVATTKPWNIEAFTRRSQGLPGSWMLVDAPEALTLTLIENNNFRYVFFPHWSWRVPAEVLEAAECVCFHMTDVPFGRGGSPLQNLIERNVKETVMTALRMVEDIDAGPVYFKRPLSLEGRAQDIFYRAADLVYDMIGEIVAAEPHPAPQSGEPVCFPRRKPEQSLLPRDGSAEYLYDFIRMLDAETYPRGFIEHGIWRLEFSHPELIGDSVTSRVLFKARED